MKNVKLNFLKCYLFIIFIIISKIAFTQVVVDNCDQTTVTERNNARLLAYDKTGNLHLVYYDSGIYHSVSNNDGRSWSSPSLITSLGRNPSLAIDSSNTLHLVYKMGGVNAYSIGHYTYNSGVWSFQDTIYHNTLHFSSRPVIAIDPENNFHCVWQVTSYGSYSNSEILYKKYNAVSGWDIAATQISKTLGASEYPTLTTDSNNKVYAFWKDSEESTFYPKRVLMKKNTPGSGWDSNYSIACETSVDDQYATMDPSVVTDSQNNVHLVWKDNSTSQTNVYHKKYNGTSWGIAEFVSLTETSSINPSISVDSLDNLYVVWAEKNADYFVFDIMSKKFNKSTGIWEDMINISNTLNVDSRNPNIPIVTKDSIIAVWTEGDTNPFKVMVNRSTLTSVNTNDYNNIDSFNIFPNPSTGIYFIKGAETGTIEVIDCNGQGIYKSSFCSTPHKIDLGNKDNGIYFLRLVSSDNEKKVSTVKLVKYEK